MSALSLAELIIFRYLNKFNIAPKEHSLRDFRRLHCI